MSWHVLYPVIGLLALASALLACRPDSAAQAPDWTAALEHAPHEAGAREYEGQVRPLGDASARPQFRYERWVRDEGEALGSRHVTRAADDERALIVHDAVHDARFELTELRVLDRSRGVVGRVQVDADRLVFERHRRGRTRTRVEAIGAPLVAGPTLFGWARAHWDELVAGAALPVRFAVVEDARSYAFELRMSGRAAGTTTLTLTATSPLVRAAVPSMHLVFDDATGQIRSYHGRVPPPRSNGRPLDADVVYVHDAPRHAAAPAPR